jgi:hypothetical protein
MHRVSRKQSKHTIIVQLKIVIAQLLVKVGGSFRKRENDLIKDNISGNIDTTRVKVKALVSLVKRAIP